MEANSIPEVNQIVNNNLDYMNENPELFTFSHQARIRIYNIMRMKRRYTELIYQN